MSTFLLSKKHFNLLEGERFTFVEESQASPHVRTCFMEVGRTLHSVIRRGLVVSSSTLFSLQPTSKRLEPRDYQHVCVFTEPLPESRYTRVVLLVTKTFSMHLEHSLRCDTIAMKYLLLCSVLFFSTRWCVDLFRDGRKRRRLRFQLIPVSIRGKMLSYLTQWRAQRFFNCLDTTFE